MFKREKEKNSQYSRTNIVRKGRFALFGGCQLGESVDSCPRTNSELTLGARASKGSCRGVLAEGGAEQKVSSESHLEIREVGGLTSTILIKYS